MAFATTSLFKFNNDKEREEKLQLINNLKEKWEALKAEAPVTEAEEIEEVEETEEVEEYNLSMVKASYQYIFGNKKEFIEKYIKSE